MALLMGNLGVYKFIALLLGVSILSHNFFFGWRFFHLSKVSGWHFWGLSSFPYPAGTRGYPAILEHPQGGIQMSTWGIWTWEYFSFFVFWMKILPSHISGARVGSLSSKSSGSLDPSKNIGIIIRHYKQSVLRGGYKDFLFLPRSPGRWSNLTDRLCQ